MNSKTISLPDGRTLSLTGNESPEQLQQLKQKLRERYKQTSADLPQPAPVKNADPQDQPSTQLPTIDPTPVEQSTLMRKAAIGAQELVSGVSNVGINMNPFRANLTDYVFFHFFLQI